MIKFKNALSITVCTLFNITQATSILFMYEDTYDTDNSLFFNIAAKLSLPLVTSIFTDSYIAEFAVHTVFNVYCELGIESEANVSHFIRRALIDAAHVSIKYLLSDEIPTNQISQDEASAEYIIDDIIPQEIIPDNFMLHSNAME